MPLPVAPFNPADSIYAGLTVVQLKLDAALSGVSAATDTITKTAHGLAVGDQVQFVSGTGFTGLVAGTNYFVVAAPTADTFKVSATAGGTALTPGTSTVGVFAPVIVLEVANLTDDPDQEEKSLDRPDSEGVMRAARTLQNKVKEKQTFGLDEVKRLLKIFRGALRGRRIGTATYWIPDPDDAANTVALKSEDDFACTVMRDGSMKFGDGDFTKATIRITSNKAGDLSWTADASTA